MSQILCRSLDPSKKNGVFLKYFVFFFFGVPDWLIRALCLSAFGSLSDEKSPNLKNSFLDEEAGFPAEGQLSRRESFYGFFLNIKFLAKFEILNKKNGVKNPIIFCLMFFFFCS